MENVKQEWKNVRNKEKMLKEYFSAFISFQMLQISKILCPIDREFWNWILQLFPMTTNIQDQQRFKGYDTFWIKFLMHKQKFFTAFSSWLHSEGASVYENEQPDYKNEQAVLSLQATYHFLQVFVQSMNS